MTAIGISDRDPVVQGNNEVGRLNLKGQQKPQYLIDAIEAEEKAWKHFVCGAYSIFSNEYNDYHNAAENRRAAYARYNEECKNENH